jgi:hypothetical protein
LLHNFIGSPNPVLGDRVFYLISNACHDIATHKLHD